MGCSDSQLKSTGEVQGEENPKPKVIRFAPGVEDDTQEVREQNPKLKKAASGKSRSKSKGKSTHKNKQSLEASEIDEKENKLKVKKARHLRQKPEHQKFIEDILQKSRGKLTSQFPEIPKNNSGFIKPVVEYPAASTKGQILPNESKLKQKSKWNTPICDGVKVKEGVAEFNESYISVNETSKSPYKQKQIQKRLNDIKNGRFEESQSGKIAREKHVHLFQSYQPLYL